ncbi:sigma-54-dependent Fis family transcriptional regulator [Nibricoccus aquaticus]|uniref:Sigma-54-dependent Fis family transcriptional regulator n=1 Tax=Nibricoccus aquaticus TaxID=2576891 RepID=A0A290Q6F7_9BACT|nr:sigma-54 dependent transcriptional regulator [Nibricoccus aquaticus]ATC64084.1 sigma-54-dependent Fis family transcriptional regulator [Nibricoccus aquaticus]
MSLERILVLDDEPLIQKVLDELFKRKKFTVTIASSIAQAEAVLAKETFDLIMLDVRLPDGDGQQFLERVSTLPDRPLVVMMTGHGTIESAVSCMRAGAFDYLIKPFSPGQIEIILKKADSYRQLVKVNRYFSEQDGGEGDLLGKGPAMQRLRQLVDRVAPTDATVLITGENGTGKEMIARELYRHSPRRNEPYIKINCAALSENLIESELFGHEKGSFTGATDRREGRFELANRGTLLLDEVSEIPPNLQAKLLRVLQEREFERVGGTKTIKVNVRLLATSNRDLMHFVEKGHFRSDLYYRLNVFPVQVPPLRERAEDIVILAEAFLRRCARKHGLKIPGFSETAVTALTTYPWPGNVRELQNTIERAVILSETGRPISTAALGLPSLAGRSMVGAAIPVSASASSSPPMPEPLPIFNAPAPTAAPTVPPFPTPSHGTTPPLNFSTPPMVPTATPPSFPVAPAAPETASAAPAPAPIIPLEEMEKQAILSALRATNGNRTKTAEMLKISIRTLRNKLNEYRAQGETIEGDGDGE